MEIVVEQTQSYKIWHLTWQKYQDLVWFLYTILYIDISIIYSYLERRKGNVIMENLESCCLTNIPRLD